MEWNYFVPPRDEQEAKSNIDGLFKEYKEAQQNSVERAAIITELEECNPLDVPGLLSHLQDKDIDGIILAVWGLGWTRDKRAYEPLLTFLLAEHEDKYLRLALIRAIGSLNYNDDRAITPLLKALKDADSDIRLEAAQALEAFDTTEVVEALKEIAGADVPRVEAAAKAALGYMRRYKG